MERDIYLVEARRARQLSQVELALRAGVHQSAISKLENNRKANPRIDVVKRLRAALRLPRETELRFGRRPSRVTRVTPARSVEAAAR